MEENFPEPADLLRYLRGELSEWEMAAYLGKILNVAFVTLRHYEIEPAVVLSISADFVRAHRILPIHLQENVLTVALADPNLISLLHNLQETTGK